jgi:RHS repeat-associated protein
VSYAYDNANELTSVTDWNSSAITYAYDDAGRLTSKTLPASTGVVSSYTYDTANRLTGITHVKDGSTTIASVSYTVDAVGNRTQRVDQAGTHTYAYDNLYRLTSVTYPGPTTTSYAFDAFGNRTSMTDGTGTTAYAYDDAERLTSVTPPTPQPAVSYSWDNNGDLTARGSDTFTWDYEDRMVGATVGGTTTTFTYRGDGLRNSRTTGGVTTGFAWDINRGLPVVLDDGNQYVYGAGLASMVTGSGAYYYLADGLGSTMVIVDTSGAVQKSYTYDVYGKPTATGTLANEFDFAGQETDPTGLQYLRARYMDPATGTFLSRDPLAGLPGWSGSPFGYGAHSPVRFADPAGLREDDGADNSSCSVCWIYTTHGTIDGQLWWTESEYDAGDPTGRSRACRLVGEYTKCSDTDAPTFNAWDQILEKWIAEQDIADLATLILNVAPFGKGRGEAGPAYKTESEAAKAATEHGWKEVGKIVGHGGKIQRLFKDSEGRQIVRDLDGHGGKAWKILDDKGRVIGALGRDLSPK